MILEEDHCLARDGGAPASPKMAGLLACAIDRPPTICIRAGIRRVAQHLGQRVAVWPMPFQLALGRPRADPIRQLDVMTDEVGQHAIERMTTLENVEDETDRRPDLLVGIKHHVA
jgi:hypothetical protein